MDIKALLAAYAKSKTQYGGTGLFLMVLLCIGQGATHNLGFAWDGTVYAIPVSLSGGIAAVAAAFYGLVLWGRGTASGPLVDAAAQQAARLAKLARQAKAYEAALAEAQGAARLPAENGKGSLLDEFTAKLAEATRAQSAPATEKPEGATPCADSSPSS